MRHVLSILLLIFFSTLATGIPQYLHQREHEHQHATPHDNDHCPLCAQFHAPLATPTALTWLIDSGQWVRYLSSSPSTRIPKPVPPKSPAAARRLLPPADRPPPIPSFQFAGDSPCTPPLERRHSPPLCSPFPPSPLLAQQTPTTQPATAPDDTYHTTLSKVIVSSDLDSVRQQIAPSLGAVTYTITQAQIQNIPGGENASFQQVLLRAPGVVLDSFGQEHVRGEHGNLTYRVNGVLLPEPLQGFGQELDTRLIQSATLITGSLPAQFGFHTAGIVDVQTKSGSSLNGTELSIYGGSYNTLIPSFQTGGTVKDLDYFVTGSYNHNGLGIENPTSSHNALHDYTDQQRLFTYLSYHIDNSSRLSLLFNAANADFQIPNTPGLTPAFNLNGTTTADSRNINENQNEQSYYTVLSYEKSFDAFSFQLSGFTSYGQINFHPDPVNDLLFQGVAGQVYNNFLTNGIQFDSSWIIDDQHTLRSGFLADVTCEKLDSNTSVFPADAAGAQTSNQPFSIPDHSGNSALEAGIYVQDEWRLNPHLTLNYGFRYDRFDANFDHEGQLSPRANFVWTIDDLTTAHAGYARYFVPPPPQNLPLSTLNKFRNTTNAPPNFTDSPPQVERSNYYDIGLSRQITKPWQISIDGFYKQARNLIDSGQFGAPVILSPFNYSQGTVYGAELSSTYTDGGLSLYGNFSWVRTFGKNIISQQYLIDTDELAFIKSNSIHLDHESDYTISAGASYAWKYDRLYVDFLFGSGLRNGFANTGKQPAYYPVNIGYAHTFRLGNSDKNVIKLRFDIVNLFDLSYQLRDGSGIGVGAPQFGARRGFFLGLAYDF